MIRLVGFRRRRRRSKAGSESPIEGNFAPGVERSLGSRDRAVRHPGMQFRQHRRRRLTSELPSEADVSGD
jgi:hypothetical protein